MSRNIFLRPAHQSEAKQIIDWWALEHAEDPMMLFYPSTEIFCAYNAKPILFTPVQTVAVIEGFASNPEASIGERAIAMHETLHGIAFLANRGGIREVLYMSGPDDKAIDRMGAKEGFEQVPWKVYRLKLRKHEQEKGQTGL